MRNDRPNREHGLLFMFTVAQHILLTGDHKLDYVLDHENKKSEYCRGKGPLLKIHFNGQKR